MEKEIIGYKAPYDLFDSKIKKDTLYKLNNFTINTYYPEEFSKTSPYLLPKEIVEQWEPVYKEEFQAGDWVTVTKLPETAHWIHETEERTFQLNGVNKFYSCTYKNNIYKERYGLEKCTFRKATPEEIEKASKTIVKMHSSNNIEFEIEVVNKKAYYRPDNKEFTKDYIESILGLFKHYDFLKSPYTVSIDSVKIGCMEGVKKEDIQKVYNLIK